MKPRIGRVLVATDFSPAGARALRTAAAIARREDAALQILHVAPPRRWMSSFWKANDSIVERAYSQARAALQCVAAELAGNGPANVSTGLVMGAASRAIARAAAESRADLLVVGARGEHETATHEPGLGGTATALLAATPVPLLLVRSEYGRVARRVLAAVDLSAGSAPIVDWARALAGNSTLHVFHAYEVPFAARLELYGVHRESVDAYAADEQERRERKLAALLAADEARSETIVERGDAGSLLFRCIARVEANLVVLGKHARRLRRRNTTYGNVCRYISSFTPANVLVVPPVILRAAHAGVG